MPIPDLEYLAAMATVLPRVCLPSRAGPAPTACSVPPLLPHWAVQCAVIRGASRPTCANQPRPKTRTAGTLNTKPVAGQRCSRLPIYKTWNDLAGSRLGSWHLRHLQSHHQKSNGGPLVTANVSACEKGFVSPLNAQTALFCRPHPEDWRDIRWSDEAHFAKTAQGRVRIIRKPGERYCPSCIHHAENEDDPIRERYHVWAAVSWGFKSQLVFLRGTNKYQRQDKTASHGSYLDHFPCMRDVIRPCAASRPRPGGANGSSSARSTTL
ncbi:hypothetical protein B0T16DRAFT_8175 [Cercophora newfieldiana]|uniref:Uncharacterized protein n=1 Tax=Cercophora newfieldiana TaxID=92897 RepID=A0AA40CXK0_9PEZI|nr:hypothetical protein B0T16DRAFT_8175 [Cercophora newfieldiana]